MKKVNGIKIHKLKKYFLLNIYINIFIYFNQSKI